MFHFLIKSSILLFYSFLSFRYESLVDTVDKKFQPKKRKAQKIDSPIDLSSDSESDEDIKQLKKRARRGTSVTPFSQDWLITFF